MLLSDARCPDRVAHPLTPACAMNVTATRIFSALEPLHGLAFETVELLWHAADALAFISSSRAFGHVERELVRISLGDLCPADAFVVETGACLAAGLDGPSAPGVPASVDHHDLHRALWVTAILRLAVGYSGETSAIPAAVYATWTDEIVYLEFDDAARCPVRLEHIHERAAALELLTGRSLIVSDSAMRWAAG